MIVEPASGTQVATDDPTFTVQNAQGFDAGQASYTFHVLTASGTREVVSVTVPAGSGRTSARMTGLLPRGMALLWRVTALAGTAQKTSATASLRLPAVECDEFRNPFAKSVVDSFLSACAVQRNHYQDPEEVLGPPDFHGKGPDAFFGFMSLGEGGHVTVDMGHCMSDQPGQNEIRVYQSVSREAVTVSVAGRPEGPFQQIGFRFPCGDLSDEARSGHCDFDLAAAEVEQARYIRIDDGELFPCERGDTVTEGADIDAVRSPVG